MQITIQIVWLIPAAIAIIGLVISIDKQAALENEARKKYTQGKCHTLQELQQKVSGEEYISRSHFLAYQSIEQSSAATIFRFVMVGLLILSLWSAFDFTNFAAKRVALTPNEKS